MTTSEKGTALVTGASSGIGAIYADRLARRRGYDLILVARNRGRLDSLAKRLTDETDRAVEVVTADLNDKADLGRIETLLRTDTGITVLVNNAGVAALGPAFGVRRRQNGRQDYAQCQSPHPAEAASVSS